MEHNTLGEWSDGDDEWIWEIDESECSKPKTDNVIHNIETKETIVEDEEWSKSDADNVIRNIETEKMIVEDGERSDPEADNIQNTQMGDGKKRKREDEVEEIGRVNVDIIHVEAPQVSGRKKPRSIVNIKEFLATKKSVITIKNDDDLCLARALVIAIARVEKEPNYLYLTRPDCRALEKRAKALHIAANVPLGPCGLSEVALFQKHLTSYEITVVSGINDNSIIYPPQPSTDRNITPVYLHLHNGHYDVITTISGFLNRSYFCHICRRAYSKKFDHMCPDMSKLCARFDCIPGVTVKCKECDRTFKSQTCYNNHKEPVGRARSICQTIRKCERCGKEADVRKLKRHIC